MRLVRIALANVNSTVGACRSNVDRSISLARAAAADGATLVAMPEQVVGGYPPEDLIQWRAFVDAQQAELRRFARETAPLSCPCVVGLIVARSSHLYNVAALVHAGQVWGFVPKEKLPLYNSPAAAPVSTTPSTASPSATLSSSSTWPPFHSRYARTLGRPTGPCDGVRTPGRSSW
jgi:predicted amidohydrolase